MIYRFKLTSGRKDGFLREYHFPIEATLYDFHRFIQDDLDFDHSQMATFLCASKKGVQVQYSLFEMDNISLKDVLDKHKKIFNYIFDFFHDRFLIIEVLGKAEKQSRKSYPMVAESQGNAPGQFEEKVIHDPLPMINDQEDSYDSDDLDSLEKGDKV